MRILYRKILLYKDYMTMMVMQWSKSRALGALEYNNSGQKGQPWNLLRSKSLKMLRAVGALEYNKTVKKGQLFSFISLGARSPNVLC